MFFMLECFSPDEADHAQFTSLPEDDDLSWLSGRRFAEPPLPPVRLTIEFGEGGLLPEFTDVPLPLMSRRLATALENAGVTNIDYYETEIHDLQTDEVHHDLLAFNLIGAISAADLANSQYSAPDGPLISVDFDSLVIDEGKTRGALMFRLAESVNAIVVHESVKNVIEAAGIDTLTFIPPEEWVG